MRPNGISFDLGMPTAPVALVELDLPPDRTVALESGTGAVGEGLLTGPHPADVPELRRWKIACPGRTRVSFRKAM